MAFLFPVTSPAAGAAAPGSSSAPATPLERWLAPLTALAASLRLSTAPPEYALPLLVEENVKAQVANVVEAAPLLDAWRAQKRVWVHGWVYEVEKGTLKDLGVSKGPESVEAGPAAATDA